MESENTLSEELRPRVSRSQFIRLGAVLGVSAAASSALAACGGSETSSGGSGGSEGQPEAGSSGGEAIAAESDVAAGSAKPFKDGGNDAVLVHLEGGDFVAYSAICTHQQCTVAYRDAQLVCPCHGSIFDPANGGAVVNGPAKTPLSEIPVEVRDGEVFKA